MSACNQGCGVLRRACCRDTGSTPDHSGAAARTWVFPPVLARAAACGAVKPAPIRRSEDSSSDADAPSSRALHLLRAHSGISFRMLEHPLPGTSNDVLEVGMLRPPVQLFADFV